MFSGTVNNSTMAVPMMPPPFTPPAYGNIPFQPPFRLPFYPAVCNYYTSPPLYNSPSSNLNSCPLPADFSQPPPGYGANAYHLSQNFGNSNVVPSYQHVHMANVRSANFAGYPASNSSPMGNGNQFSWPPPPVSQMNGGSTNNSNRFPNLGNNHRHSSAREWPYFCESCDRGFTSMMKFKEHKSQHKTCGREGCTFSAHEKIVEKHILMQHRTPGLFNRIVKGYSPEEIQKWISERKKLFPTKEKIEVKEAQREEMKKRGERYAERRQKFNQKNSNLKSNRFNRSALNKNRQFRNKPFGRGRNISANGTIDENNQPRNKKRISSVQEDEDCQLRNLLPFKGTAYYQRLGNISANEKYEEHPITDDDDISIWSDDENVKVIQCNLVNVDKNVISELEKSSEISQQENNGEEDCLDKYFKNCDDVDQTDEVFDDCDMADENGEQTHSLDMKDDPKVHTDAPVNDSITVDSGVGDKPVLKATSSLALLQCYDSDDDSNVEEDDTVDLNNSKINSSSDKIEPDINDLSVVDKPEECSFKRMSESSENPEIELLYKFESEKNNHSSDDSGPDECSSKRISIEENCNYQMNSWPLEVTKPSTDKNLNENTEPIAGSLRGANEAETNISAGNEGDGDDGCESKKRKRKRRKDSKCEVECGEDSDMKSIRETNLPRVFHSRKKYKPPTLLEKLLHSEIKHERNVLLQCIRYAVDNNYFGIDDKNSS